MCVSMLDVGGGCFWGWDGERENESDFNRRCESERVPERERLWLEIDFSQRKTVSHFNPHKHKATVSNKSHGTYENILFLQPEQLNANDFKLSTEKKISLQT